MSVGSLAPGIKVRNKEEILQEIQQRDIVSFEDEIADPVIYSMQGGLFKFIKDRMNTFLRNEPEFNVLLANIIVRLSSFPVKIDILDGQFVSTTSPFDKTHANLTMLHMIMFDQPLTLDKGKIDVFSLMSSITTINLRVDEFMQDENMYSLVNWAKHEGNLKDLSIPLTNAWLSSLFK